MSFPGPSLCHCACGQHSPFKEMSLRLRVVGNTVSNLIGRDWNLRPPVLEANALVLDQLAGVNTNLHDKFSVPMI